MDILKYISRSDKLINIMIKINKKALEHESIKFIVLEKPKLSL